MDCELCGAKLFSTGICSETLVGYSSPDGHMHDDNCLSMLYRCKNGHVKKIYKRRTCPVSGCDWKGKQTCWCHAGIKVAEWP